MITRSVMVLLVVLLVSAVSVGGDEKKPRLQSRLKVKLEKAVAAKDGTVWVELTFFNTTDKEQKLVNTEYRMAILDKDGEQVGDPLFLTAEIRNIVLKGKSTTDKQGAFAPELKAGQDYFLVVSVRNLTAQVKFTAK